MMLKIIKSMWKLNANVKALTILCWTVLILFDVIPERTFAAGFDCGTAKTPTEIYICVDYRLSDLDEALNKLYELALNQTKNTTLLQADQKSWLSLRNKCTSSECLIKAYRHRIAELSSSNALAKEPPQFAPWDFIVPTGSEIDGFYVKENRPVIRIFKWNIPSIYVDFISKSAKPELDSNGVKEEYRRVKSINNQADWDSAEKLGGQKFVKTSPSFMGYCSSREDADALDIYSRHNNISEISPSRVLVGFLNHETSVGISPNCDEITLPIDQGAIGNAFLFNDSLFLETLHKRALIRFNEELYSGSSLIGREVILAWESDLKQLLNKQCGVEADLAEPECLQEHLSRFIHFAQKKIH